VHHNLHSDRRNSRDGRKLRAYCAPSIVNRETEQPRAVNISWLQSMHVVMPLMMHAGCAKNEAR
jgi:hypothetical protein